jgi:hypothetical protein
MARPSQARGREGRTDQVAPLRLGGPQPSARTAPTPRIDPRALDVPRSESRAERRSDPRAERPTPRTERSTPRAERPTPRTSGRAARPPSGESRSKGSDDEKKRGKDRD